MKKYIIIIALATFLPSIHGQESRPEVVVHRGANRLAPENTRASIRKAIEHGADWIELDVRSSRDGVFYNLHDRSVDRTTDGKGLLRNLTSAEIDRLDAGSRFSPDFAGERIPRIDELLDELDGKARVYFDVKDADLPALIRLVREKGFAGRSFFWFGSRETQREFVRLAPDMKIKVNADSVSQLERWLKECAPAIVETSLKAALVPAFRDFCRRHDIRIMVNVIGESTGVYRDVLRSGVDMVNLDEPEAFTEQ
jgi:glycerophosphoryl diester phosphodiesterase